MLSGQWFLWELCWRYAPYTQLCWKVFTPEATYLQLRNVTLSIYELKLEICLSLMSTLLCLIFCVKSREFAASGNQSMLIRLWYVICSKLFVLPIITAYSVWVMMILWRQTWSLHEAEEAFVLLQQIFQTFVTLWHDHENSILLCLIYTYTYKIMWYGFKIVYTCSPRMVYDWSLMHLRPPKYVKLINC